MSTVTETRRLHNDAPGEAVTVTETTDWRATTGRVLGGVAGAILIVLGAVALLRAGLPTTLEQFTSEHVNSGWLHHTVLLALIHLTAGASLVSAVGFGAFGPRAVSSGIITLVIGVIVWIEPTALHDTFGIHRVHGLTYAVIGLVMIGAGWLIGRSATVVRRVIAD